MGNNYFMKHLCFLLIIQYSAYSQGQGYTKCKVYQYAGTD
jgi:hypothetical protein